jgi:ATP:ADP antiporter, AAA family
MSAPQSESNAGFGQLLALVKPGEWRLVLLAQLCFFGVLTCYYILRPIRDSLAAAAGGSKVLPTLFLYVFVVMLVMAPIFGALFAKLARRVLVPVIYLFFVINILLIAWILNFDLDLWHKTLAYYVWLSVFNLFIVSVFWSCMADVFVPERAKRLYGLVALGGTLGALSGPAMAALLVKQVDRSGLCVLAAGFLLMSFFCMLQLFHEVKKEGAVQGNAVDASQALGGSIFQGAIATLQNPLMRRLALLLLCADFVASILYTLQSNYLRDYVPLEEDRIALTSWIDLSANGLQIILQVFAVRWFLQRFGSGKTMALANAANMFGLLLAALLVAPWLVLVALALTRGAGYGLINPARESIYPMVDRETRFKAKNFIDTVVWRGGDVMSITLTSWLVDSVRLPTPQFFLLCAGFSLAAVMLSWRLDSLIPKQSEGAEKLASPS